MKRYEIGVFEPKEPKAHGPIREELLANEIVLRAVYDWKLLCKAVEKGVKNPGCTQYNFAELREFFQSGWCDLLLQGTELTGAGVLRELENLLEKAERNRKEAEACRESTSMP